MIRFFSAAILSVAVILNASVIFAAKPPPVKEIIYIPHDDRPISLSQSIDIIERAGYKVVTPPANLLGNRNYMGNPDGLWKWLEDALLKAKRDKTVDIRACVVSTDAMLYGSLVGSRKHNYSQKQLYDRVKKFVQIRKKYPGKEFYAFSSIMRTPKSAEASGHMEPDYYENYGEDIFRYTALLDKQEVASLNKRNEAELKFLKSLLPDSALNDWNTRRNKNFNANKALIDLAKANTFDYLILGRDDNAPYCATHQERVKLLKYSGTLSKEIQHQAAGIDEAGLLLLTRAVLKDKNLSPYVFVRYNWGSGELVIPAYSDEAIKYSVDDEIEIAGARRTEDVKHADLVLAVNTNPNGKTGDGALYSNNTKEREGTKYFTGIIEEYLAMKKPVAVADIAYSNGADNALMEALKQKNLLFKLTGYAGLNTATNSAGFAISLGLLAKDMKVESKNELLKTRYLDDWMYQGNIRTIVARQLTWLKGDGVYGALGDKREWAEERTRHIFDSFLRQDLPVVESGDLKINLPWNRMFEADITINRNEGDKTKKPSIQKGKTIKTGKNKK